MTLPNFNSFAFFFKFNFNYDVLKKPFNITLISLQEKYLFQKIFILLLIHTVLTKLLLYLNKNHIHKKNLRFLKIFNNN